MAADDAPTLYRVAGPYFTWKDHGSIEMAVAKHPVTLKWGNTRWQTLKSLN